MISNHIIIVTRTVVDYVKCTQNLTALFPQEFSEVVKKSMKLGNYSSTPIIWQNFQ